MKNQHKLFRALKARNKAHQAWIDAKGEDKAKALADFLSKKEAVQRILDERNITVPQMGVS